MRLKLSAAKVSVLVSAPSVIEYTSIGVKVLKLNIVTQLAQEANSTKEPVAALLLRPALLAAGAKVTEVAVKVSDPAEPEEIDN
jgi:hypothetical protein